MNRTRLRYAVPAALWAVAALSVSSPLAAAESGDASKPYTVECTKNAESGAETCKVDKKTYIGWRTYHSTCYVCHAQDAVGSSFAPSLIERLKVISHERFLDVVKNGYKGQIGVMPAWKDNPNVNTRFEDLYAYLKARSDGVLPPGRPGRLGR